MDKSSGLDFINQMFPVEASLSCVESFMQKICDEIRRVDATILAVVSQQGNSGTRAKENLNDAICAAEELSHKIQEIKSKAEQTEAMVQDICSDIKKLDFAKKNITTAVTALSRLTMLVSAVQQLQVMTSKRQYKEAATQLEAINELCNHFKAYMDLPKIMELREKLKNIKQILKFHVFSDFSSLGTGTETEELFLLKKLSDSCLVVDALEPSVREELINNFCSRELTSYEQIYVGAELKTLDEIELIYNQLSCLIRKNQGKWTIFPASWHVPYRLCIQLSRKTRVQVESILVNLKEKSDVEKLLLELKRTLEFERELEMKFGGGGSIGDDIIGGGGNNSQKVGFFNFRGMISSCFEPHLTIYIEKEEMELMQLLEKVVQEETWDIEEESQTNILSSSIQLFFTIKRSLKRCSALTKNQTLFNLFKVFQRVLNAYATKLFVKLPKGGTSIIAAATGMDGRIKVSEKDERMICYIVNTADYCHKTSGDLVEEVSTIIHPPYANGVDISEVQDAFSSVITSALVTLVHGLETKFDKEMADMTRVSWGIFKSVGDQSNK
ncbi:hypothetical protein AXX17_AT1G45150 [Arabidopsis thaliana]|uniref:Vps53 N-terminal domain-containing protein n=1 Tax=Arabidopsis thaliana TaxID=3702 RepID=A0A178WA52_ARATH|nr:hypothetical protein AXX17_AT1G45150 [Arabidopsis thaliana]